MTESLAIVALGHQAQRLHIHIQGMIIDCPSFALLSSASLNMGQAGAVFIGEDAIRSLLSRCCRMS